MTSLHSPVSQNNQHNIPSSRPFISKPATMSSNQEIRTIVIERKAATFWPAQSSASSLLSSSTWITYGVGLVLICRPPGPPKALMLLISRAWSRAEIKLWSVSLIFSSDAKLPQILAAYVWRSGQSLALAFDYELWNHYLDGWELLGYSRIKELLLRS